MFLYILFHPVYIPEPVLVLQNRGPSGPGFVRPSLDGDPDLDAEIEIEIRTLNVLRKIIAFI